MVERAPSFRGLSYEYQKRKDTHCVKINEKTYEFDVKDPNVCQILKENFIIILEYIEELERYFNKKNDETFPDLLKIADHLHYTSLESYFDHIKLILESWKKNPDKKGLPSNDSLDKCCICLCELYDDILKYTPEQICKQLSETDENDAIKLGKCQGHYFHKICLDGYLKSQKQSFLTCPVCKVFYGIMKGERMKKEKKKKMI